MNNTLQVLKLSGHCIIELEERETKKILRSIMRPCRYYITATTKVSGGRIGKKSKSVYYVLVVMMSITSISTVCVIIIGILSRSQSRSLLEFSTVDPLTLCFVAISTFT